MPVGCVFSMNVNPFQCVEVRTFLRVIKYLHSVVDGIEGMCVFVEMCKSGRVACGYAGGLLNSITQITVFLYVRTMSVLLSHDNITPFTSEKNHTFRSRKYHSFYVTTILFLMSWLLIIFWICS